MTLLCVVRNPPILTTKTEQYPLERKSKYMYKGAVSCVLNDKIKFCPSTKKDPRRNGGPARGTNGGCSNLKLSIVH